MAITLKKITLWRKEVDNKPGVACHLPIVLFSAASRCFTPILAFSCKARS
jgi:hypothetical protein